VSFISPNQYAKLRGVSHTAISKMVRSGKLTLVNGKVDTSAADKQLLENIDPRQHSKIADSIRELTGQAPEEGAGKPASGPERGTFLYARLQHEMAKAARAALDVQRMQGKVIEKDLVKREIGNMIGAAKMRLLAIGNKLAQELALENDPVECQALIETEVSDALAELLKWEPSAAA